MVLSEVKDWEKKHFDVSGDGAAHHAVAIQKGDHTAIDRFSNGVCYFCEKNRYVTASVIFVCNICIEKKGMWHVLDFAGQRPWKMCVNCGKKTLRVAEISARTCRNCKKKVANTIRTQNKRGMEEVDPFVRDLRRKQGKDWKAISGMDNFHIRL